MRAKRSRFRCEFLRQSAGGSPPARARALHGLGQFIRKSAPCAVRTDRRNGDAIGHRRDAESCREYFFKVMLANVDILAAAAQILAASRRLRDALNSCLQQHLRYSMQRHYRANQSPRKLDYPNASCRRLHGPRVTPSMHVLAGMFYARASVTPKRVPRSLPTQKVLATVVRYVKLRAQLRARHRPLAHQNAPS